MWTAVFLPVGFVAWILRVALRREDPQISLRNIVQRYGTGCCNLLASQTPVRVENKAGDLPRPCIIAANHQSFFDPYCIGFFPVYAPTFVVRAWPFRIPLYGRVMRRAGYVNSEESDREVFFQQAEAVVRSGATLVVFPEGTRSATGAVGRFRSGVFKVAVACNVPVVPLCINGTGAVFPKGSRFGRPASVKVTLLPPVDPARFSAYGKLSHRYLQKNVKFAIEKELG